MHDSSKKPVPMAKDVYGEVRWCYFRPSGELVTRSLHLHIAVMVRSATFRCMSDIGYGMKMRGFSAVPLKQLARGIGVVGSGSRNVEDR